MSLQIPSVLFLSVSVLFFSHFQLSISLTSLLVLFLENKHTYFFFFKGPLLKGKSWFFTEQIMNSVNTKQIDSAWVSDDLAKKEHCLEIEHQKLCC